MDEQRLYGLQDAEVMQFDPASVYESQIAPNVDEHDRRPWLIEEWSVHPADYGVPTAETIVERIVESIADDGEIDEYGFDQFAAAALAEDVLAIAGALRAALASKVTWRMADKHLRTLTVTWDDAGEPLIDGEPMYVKSGGDQHE